MKVYDIDIGGMEEIQHDIKFITISGNILQIHYENGNISTWKLVE